MRINGSTSGVQALQTPQYQPTATMARAEAPGEQENDRDRDDALKAMGIGTKVNLLA